MATLRNINELLPNCTGFTFETFIRPILEHLTGPDTPIRERFKLAQLCGMIHTKAFLDSRAIFEKYKAGLLEVCANAQEEALGEPMVKLIMSLFEPVARSHSSSSPLTSAPSSPVRSPHLKKACSWTPPPVAIPSPA
jgi:hypothetical protein